MGIFKPPASGSPADAAIKKISFAKAFLKDAKDSIKVDSNNTNIPNRFSNQM